MTHQTRRSFIKAAAATGFAAAEAEFVLRIGTAPPAGKTHFTLAEAANLIDAVHVGIEIASHVIRVGHVELERAATWDEIAALGQRDEVVLACVDPETEGRRLRLWRPASSSRPTDPPGRPPPSADAQPLPEST